MGGKGAAEERMKRSELSATIARCSRARADRLMNCRRRGIPRGSKFGETTEKVAGIEWRNGNHRAAGKQRGQTRHQRMGVMHRHHAQVSVRRGQMERADGQVGACDHRRLPRRHDLRPSDGAGSAKHEGDIVVAGESRISKGFETASARPR